MQLLDGKRVSEHLRAQLAEEVKLITTQSGKAPLLVVILVGDDKASQIYVRNKHVACQKMGMRSQVIQLSTATSEDELLSSVDRLNRDPDVDGILVQMPLPAHINSFRVLEALDPWKDADGLTSRQLGLLMLGKGKIKPCTPAGVMEILKFYKVPTEGVRAVVVGRSQIVGKPMAQLLVEANATVTVVHSRTPDMRSIVQSADLVVVAAGKAGLLGPKDFKKGAVLVDVGIHRMISSTSGVEVIVGDVRTNDGDLHLDQVLSARTPVPGGVGPMTITMLLKNTVELARMHVEG